MKPFTSVFLFLFLTSCAGYQTILQGNGVSMTKVHLEPDEDLQDLKPVKAKFCAVTFGGGPRYSTDIIIHVQKKYKADFIRKFKLSEELVHPFKYCYHLSGIPSRIVKSKPNRP